jgi:hypothetical protein
MFIDDALFKVRDEISSDPEAEMLITTGFWLAALVDNVTKKSMLDVPDTVLVDDELIERPM